MQLASEKSFHMCGMGAADIVHEKSLRMECKSQISTREFSFSVANFISVPPNTVLENRVENCTMCLALPAKVITLKGDKAQVDFGEGVLREVNLTLVEAKVGDYVLVHAGYAIQILDEKEALETLSLWNEILAAETKTVQA